MTIKPALPTPAGKHEFLAAVRRSRKLHGGWFSAPDTEIAFNAYIEKFKSPSCASYWVRGETDELAGVINISEIVRGNFRSGYLSYCAFVPHNGRGLMTAGLRAVVSQAFRTLRLHRLEANIQPGNEPSRRLVRRLGFRCEGLSVRYLKINGRWRDHERWAVTKEEWPKVGTR